MKKIVFSFAIATVLMFGLDVSAAESFRPNPHESKISGAEVPESLKTWEAWALDGYEPDECSFAYDNTRNRQCYYISHLSLDVRGNNLTFSEKVSLKKRGYVLLPGSFEVFPSEVKHNGQYLPVININGLPYVLLEEGEYSLEGKAKSAEAIRYFSVPTEAAVVSLQKDGVEVVNPTVESSGILRLETEAAQKKETDNITYTVFRKIEDNVPLYMTVRLDINVSGSQRVENIGQIVPGNFALMDISSSIPAYVRQNGELISEVSAGNWWIDLKFRQLNESLDLVSESSPVDNEIWVFVKDANRRVIQVPAEFAQIQTKVTNMPNDWKQYPGYEVKKGDKVNLSVIEYQERQKDNLSLIRNIKLSFDGKFYSIKDYISGSLKEDGQISMPEPFVLSSVEIDGVGQSIVVTDDKASGFEARKGNTSINTISRIDNVSKIRAAGYTRDFENLNWNLNLAPGYDLFHVSGADSVSSSWISNWNLLSIFMVVLLGVIFYYLFGLKKALVAEIAFVLLQPVMPQFIIISFVLCGLIGVERYVGKDNKSYKFIAFLKYSLLLFLALATLGFMILNIRYAMYPGITTDYRYNVLQYFVGYHFLTTFYLGTGILYLLYRIFANPARHIANKILWTALIVLGLIPGFGLMGFVVSSGFNGFLGASSVSYYEPEYAYDSSAEVMKVKAMGLSSRQQMAEGYINNNAKLANYQSLNIARNRIQTGVGFPEWSDGEINIGLKGPVSGNDYFRLYLISPLMNLILALAELLLAVLTLAFISGVNMRLPKGKMLLIATGMILFSTPGHAWDYPSDKMLGDLRTKLTKTEMPSCIPNCVSIPSASLDMSGNEVVIDVLYHSADELVVPLPTIRADGSGVIKLKTILLNGVETPNTFRKGDTLHVLLKAGINKIKIVAMADGVERFGISSNVKISLLENKSSMLDLSKTSDSWQVLIKNSKEIVKNEGLSEVSKMSIPAFFEVEKRFDIGTIWQVTTTIRRLNVSTEAASVEVALLNGERVITSEGNLLKDSIRVSFAPLEAEKQYVSILPVEENIVLKAGKDQNYREVWRLNVDTAWSFETKGVKPLNTNGAETLYVPGTGDVLTINVFRSESVAGEVITFDKVNYVLNYGRSKGSINVDLTARSSEGGNHNIVLPQGFEVVDLSIDRQNYPVSQKDNVLVVPVANGRTNVHFTAEGVINSGNIWRFPEVDLKAPAVNIEQTMQVPSERWILFAGGPVKGPAVLFWSQIPVWLLLAFLLSRFKTVELGFASWFVLLAGLSQSTQMFTIVVVSWFVLMGVRAKYSDKLKLPKFKRLVQIVLAMLTVIFVYYLIKGISNGLLGDWDMRILGNGSYTDWDTGNWYLKWYQDASSGLLPSPMVVSLPLWVYRTLMVLWSIWLSFSFVKWIKWAARSYQKDGIWSW